MKFTHLHAVLPTILFQRNARIVAIETGDDGSEIPGTGVYLHSTIHSSDRFFSDELCFVHRHCRDSYAKYIDGNQEAVKGYLRPPDGNSPKGLSLFSSLTCKNNAILD